ncbi:formate hydrogenlyase subunit 4 [Anaerobacterium chartisolvens]|uniref:Formate hydrogenlyase subunit 4 n=1 Tax=Anaerobacterium chartisolvens TaxID=1297424 RepID=A0A369B5U1_9FIRM|nr:formate hydrogenlyase subunit 4 [Anaerobacterium chartisolvens]
MFQGIVKIVVQLIITAALAPLVSGIIKKLKARVQHRKGASVFQGYFDLLKLFKKDVVVSHNASWIFTATPYIYFVSILAASLFVPAIPQLFSFGFIGDAVLVVYLIAIGRFFMALSGMDTGSTFTGMGSSREMMISALIEPSMMLVLFTVGLNPLVGSLSFQAIYKGFAAPGWGFVSPSYLLLLISMLIIVIAETARIPVDDPSTHLELTMVHEAMLLEYSGRHLALMEISASIKQLLLITVICNVFIPFGSNAGVIQALGLYVLKVLVISGVIAVIEINSVKLRLFSVPNHAALAFILAVLGFMSSFVFGR